MSSQPLGMFVSTDGSAINILLTKPENILDIRKINSDGSMEHVTITMEEIRTVFDAVNWVVRNTQLVKRRGLPH